MDGARESRIGGGGGGGDGSVGVQNRQTLSVYLKLDESKRSPPTLDHVQYNVVSITICSAVLVSGLTVYVMTRPRPVYMVDFSCYLPPDHLKCPSTAFMAQSRLVGCFDDSALEFQRMILERSGLGEETYLPEAMIVFHQNLNGCC
ncbi:unnamed protein product [Microthlaspi erraticum]|uniref:FAE domain-containing protein n=1 Tax=Microthlaspi erraticum TaxID=1685480 RepID=A0A6D2L629_9BRAS|nr:unnamed protein product [Microthlaspi erraticum]